MPKLIEWLLEFSRDRALCGPAKILGNHHVLQRQTMQLEGTGRYVEGALRLLQFVENRRPTGRRFGADADARWASFRGDLETVDRIELMIRDADAESRRASRRGWSTHFRASPPTNRSVRSWKGSTRSRPTTCGARY